MGLYRQLRKRDELHVDGPSVIFIESGRPGVTVRAAKDVTITHKKHKRRKKSADGSGKADRL